MLSCTSNSAIFSFFLSSPLNKTSVDKPGDKNRYDKSIVFQFRNRGYESRCGSRKFHCAVFKA